MQLPQNKQDRQKVIALIGVGVAAVLYGVWAGIYSPIIKKKAEAIDRIAKLEDDIAKAERQIRRMPLVERELMVVMTNLAAWSNAHILYPRLGNYLLPVREWMAEMADPMAIGSIQVDEVNLFGLPKGSMSPANPVMQIYSVRVSTFCGYDELSKLFAVIEEHNPLIAIGNVMITARPGDPLNHQISFELHLPVWTDPGYDDELNSELAALKVETE